MSYLSLHQTLSIIDVVDADMDKVAGEGFSLVSRVTCYLVVYLLFLHSFILKYSLREGNITKFLLTHYPIGNPVCSGEIQ